mmetsp:Transcript_7445/g.8577  ORF Transcript_7445/g.8577 Transcript_7445/m.8577 type:complete len:539 (-) Transcript_7445:223-1839(-)
MNQKALRKHRALGGEIIPFWSHNGQVLEGESEGGDFGFAVDQSRNGNIIAVGAGDYDGQHGFKNVGQVKVFMLRKEKWKQMGQDILGDQGDEHGHALKLSANGQTIAIGSDQSRRNTGHVKVYFWDKPHSCWVQLGNTIRGIEYGDEAGWGFDLSANGRTLAFGVPKFDGYGRDNGLTLIFTYNKGTEHWERKGHAIPGFNNNYGAARAQYGWSVALSASGDRVLSSGIFDRTNHNDWTGAVKVYDFDKHSGNWNQVGRTLFGDDKGDEFGVSVSMSKDGNIIAVGAGCYYYCDYDDRYDHHEDYYKDYVRVFRWDHGDHDWVFIGQIDREEEDIGFGISVSLSDDGKRLGIATAGEDYGYARVFEYAGTLYWTQVGQDLVIDEFEDGESGHPVSLSGDGEHLVVGSSDANRRTGEVKAYKIADDQTTSPVAGCVDSTAPMKWRGGNKPLFKTCGFVKKKPARCGRGEVAKMCPNTCGKCFEYACEDGPLEWKESNGNIQSCANVAKHPKRYCHLPIPMSTCRETCHTPMYDTLCNDK